MFLKKNSTTSNLVYAFYLEQIFLILIMKIYLDINGVLLANDKQEVNFADTGK